MPVPPNHPINHDPVFGPYRATLKTVLFKDHKGGENLLTSLASIIKEESAEVLGKSTPQEMLWPPSELYRVATNNPGLYDDAIDGTNSSTLSYDATVELLYRNHRGRAPPSTTKYSIRPVTKE